MNKTILTIGGIAALGIAGFFAWKKFGKKEGEAEDDIDNDKLKSAVATKEDDETPPTEDDVENEVDLEAEKKADELEEEADAQDESLEPSKKEERKKAREERKKARQERRAQRRKENKAKRDANKSKRKKRALTTIAIVNPALAPAILVGVGIKKIKEKRAENKEKREEKKEARQEKRQERKESRKERRAERRGRRRFDGIEEYDNFNNNLNNNYMYNDDEMFSANGGEMMDTEIYNATKKFNLDTAGLSPSSSKYIALKSRYQDKIAAIKKRYGSVGFDDEDEMFSADSGQMDKEIYYATKEFNSNTAGLTPSSPKYMAYKEQYQRKIAAIKKRYGSFDGDDEMFSVSAEMDILRPSIEQQAIRQRRIREKRRRRKLKRLAERGLSTSVAQFSDEDSDFAFNGIEF